jgi:hypothetical protein
MQKVVGSSPIIRFFFFFFFFFFSFETAARDSRDHDEQGSAQA